MTWQQIVELILSTAIILNCLAVFCFLGFSGKGNRRPNLWLMILMLAVGLKLSYPIWVFIRNNLGPGRFVIFNLTSVAYMAIGPLLFLYFRDLFKRSVKAIWIVLMFLPVFTPLISGLFRIVFPLAFMQAYALLFIILIVVAIQKKLKSKENRVLISIEKSWANALLSSFIAVWGVVNLLFISDKLYILEVVAVFIVVFYLDVYQAIHFYWQRKGSETECAKYQNSNLTAEEENEIVLRLRNMMEIEKLYLDSEITLPRMADVLGIKTHKLSQVINQKFQMTFNEFVNSYRISAVKKALLLPENRELKIASIAYDCGFNSISVFNTAFKKFVSSTPSQYRDAYFVKYQR